MRTEESHLYGHASTESLEVLQKLIYNTIIIWPSVIAQKVCDNRLKWKPSIPLIFLHTLTSFMSSFIWGQLQYLFPVWHHWHVEISVRGKRKLVFLCWVLWQYSSLVQALCGVMEVESCVDWREDVTKAGDSLVLGCLIGQSCCVFTARVSHKHTKQEYLV